MARSRPTSNKKQREQSKRRKKQEKLERKIIKKTEKYNNPSNSEIENNDGPIGKLVLSLSFGIGMISAVEKLREDDTDFFVVECGDEKVKNYFPVGDNKSFRFVSSKEDFEVILNVLREQKCIESFGTKKERLGYFKGCLQEQDAFSIAKNIVELNSLSDLGTVETKMLERLTDSLILEASIVLGIEKSESKDFIMNHISSRSS